MSARRLEVPVLIAGAGPAGSTAAVALARYGIECLVVERRSELSTLPRATAISTRSMELLRSWGLEEKVRAGGIDVEWRQWHCETLALADAGHGSPTGFPSLAQSTVVSPTVPACVPQDHLEPVLLDHLRSLPAGRVELGTEVTGVEARARGVRVVLQDVAAGASRIVDARYLIAADGAHSRVRRALGVEMCGPDRLVEAVSTLFRAPLWELVGDRRYGLYAVMRPEAEGSSCRPGAATAGSTACCTSPGALWRTSPKPAWRGGSRSARASPAWSRESSASAASRSRPTWPSASAQATRSSSATPRIAPRLVEAPG
jgi:putative polyketide hydroxylase